MLWRTRKMKRQAGSLILSARALRLTCPAPTLYPRMLLTRHQILLSGLLHRRFLLHSVCSSKMGMRHPSLSSFQALMHLSCQFLLSAHPFCLLRLFPPLVVATVQEEVQRLPSRPSRSKRKF